MTLIFTKIYSVPKVTVVRLLDLGSKSGVLLGKRQIGYPIKVGEAWIPDQSALKICSGWLRWGISELLVALGTFNCLCELNMNMNKTSVEAVISTKQNTPGKSEDTILFSGNALGKRYLEILGSVFFERDFFHLDNNRISSVWSDESIFHSLSYICSELVTSYFFGQQRTIESSNLKRAFLWINAHAI